MQPLFISNLPLSFTKKIHDHQRMYSVTMLMHDEGATTVIPCSGTLAQINKRKGIITARHVWDEVKKHDFLLTLVGEGNYAFETRYLMPVIPDPIGILSEFNVTVPDIAFIVIPERHVSHLEASGKVFFSIDIRIDVNSCPIDTKQGYWAVFANPSEWLDIDNRTVASFVYGTVLSKLIDADGWDYLVMNLDIEANPEIPRDFSGMSGGGIWWTRFSCDERLENFSVENPTEDIMIAGVSFCQTHIRERRIIGHGPKSIYELLYKHVKQSI